MNKQSMLALRSGNQMPVMGLGTWQLTKDTPGTVAAALQLGYKMIDTSGDYGTQPGTGQGIKKSGVERDAIYIVTKVEETDDAYKATQKNLDELGLEYADLMLIHRPPQSGVGQELWQGLIRAKQEGLTKDIGVSNYSARQISQLADDTGEMPMVNQIEWSPFGYSEDMLAFCQQHNIVIQAYSPLTRTRHLDDQALVDMAKKYHKTPAQILIRWDLQRGVVPLPKANQRKHLEENIDVFDFAITDDDIATLNSLNEHSSSLGELPYA